MRISRACELIALKESTEANRKLVDPVLIGVEGKSVKLEFLTNTKDLFRPKVARFCRRQVLIYQEQLLKVQEEAKKNKLGIWSL